MIKKKITIVVEADEVVFYVNKLLMEGLYYKNLKFISFHEEELRQ